MVTDYVVNDAQSDSGWDETVDVGDVEQFEYSKEILETIYEQVSEKSSDWNNGNFNSTIHGMIHNVADGDIKVFNKYATELIDDYNEDPVKTIKELNDANGFMNHFREKLTLEQIRTESKEAVDEFNEKYSDENPADDEKESNIVDFEERKKAIEEASKRREEAAKKSDEKFDNVTDKIKNKERPSPKPVSAETKEKISKGLKLARQMKAELLYESKAGIKQRTELEAKARWISARACGRDKPNDDDRARAKAVMAKIESQFLTNRAKMLKEVLEIRKTSPMEEGKKPAQLKDVISKAMKKELKVVKADRTEIKKPSQNLADQVVRARLLSDIKKVIPDAKIIKNSSIQGAVTGEVIAVRGRQVAQKLGEKEVLIHKLSESHKVEIGRVLTASRKGKDEELTITAKVPTNAPNKKNKDEIIK